MKIFGLEIKKALSPVGSAWRNAWRVISEPFAGAWQRNIEETQADLITYPTLYACVSRIASDIAKLPFSLRTRSNGGIWAETSNPSYDPVLRKPNSFQTAGQFREFWIATKLVAGNAYILKRRDNRGVVIELYVLDPSKVLPMVSDSGSVYYRLQSDSLNSIDGDGQVTVPASEIIHDRCVTIHHPLIGVPPVAAAHWPALKNMKILRNATDFFANHAQPGGLLTAPAGMTDDDAKAVQEYWDKNFSGDQSGRVAIIGADMKFTPFAMKSIDAQMIEQMRYSDEQICQPFGIPPFKVGIGMIPAALGVDGLNQLYYADALQGHIEHMESLLNEGLRIASPLGVKLDLDPLLRMDEGKRAEVEVKLVGGKIKTPDEGRARFNLGPTGGGDTLWGQTQDVPLGLLSSRERWGDDPMKPPELAGDGDPTPDPEENDQIDLNDPGTKALIFREIEKGMRNEIRH